jgi:Gpi18-like mannosyltransferase
MSEPRVSRRSPFLVALATLLLLECALLTATAVYLVIELLIAVPDSYATAIAVLVLVLLAAVWLAVMAVHALRGRYWIRGAAVTWQALQIAIGIGSFQGPLARPDIAWLLIIPAVVVLVLLFTPPVVEATKRREN